MKNLLKHLLSLILPVTALVIVPILIESNLTLVVDGCFAIGLILVIAGMTLLSVTIGMFTRIGRGTLAPWSPPEKLVVSGIYSYVRNPMITGVMIVLLGESLAFHSQNIFIWLIIFFVINNVYFIFSEEPALAARFGDEYLKYKRNVPRWLPRITPWRPEVRKNGM
jgi:protein-S-isoprenylcysteine O-methyltransferase Ste14